MAKHRKRAGQVGQSIAGELRRAVLRAVVHAVGEVEPAASARAVVNRLRGNRLHGNRLDSANGRQDDASAAGVDPLEGCLHAVSARWLHELIASLVERELLVLGDDNRLSVSSDGRRIARRADGSLAELFPAAPALGRRPELESRLIALRRDLARSEGRPAFSVFDNATLARVCERAPITLGELAEVRGFGPRRLARYGRRITRAVRDATGSG